MPLYEYLCVNCGSSFEYLVRSPASKETILCPSCTSAQVNKKFSTFGMKGGAGGSSVAAGDACSTGGG